jgi:hypothetical protein
MSCGPAESDYGGSERPRECEPHNVFVDRVVAGGIDKLDLLLVVDNSSGMRDEQALFARALPELVDTLPVEDVHVAVVTSSLGGSAAADTCVAGDSVDNAHLLGTLPRAEGIAPDGFLSWTGEEGGGAFSNRVSELVLASGEQGCAFEAPLEAWYRFLVEPYPWTRIVRQNCPYGADTNQWCNGPETDAAGVPLMDEALLEQRAQFLRPDSALVIVMLSDENDCSLRAHGQSWRLTQFVDDAGNPNPAYKGTAVCDEQPNDPCCHSCGAQPPVGCPTEVGSDGQSVGQGCAEARFEVGSELDAPNLRCFQQKERFGVDYLYPAERYVNALELPALCPFADSVHPDATGSDGSPVCGVNREFVVENPLFVDARNPGMILLAGVVGVPWQDLAVDPRADTLVYRTSTGEPDEAIAWDWLLGDADDPKPVPLDPLMQESIAPREGRSPGTGELLASPDSAPGTNSSNGHERANPRSADLQYACIFPLDEPRACPSEQDVAAATEAGQSLSACECTLGGRSDELNPLCQQPDGSYSTVQTHAGAMPGTRQLSVLRELGTQAVAASICPRQLTNPEAQDYGHRPAMGAIRRALEPILAPPCFPRTLPAVDGRVGCRLFELSPNGPAPCGAGRSNPRESDVGALARWTERFGLDPASTGICELEQLRGSALDECLTSEQAEGDGWCYVDPEAGVGYEALVSHR